MATKLQVTELDFDDIKTNLKTHKRTLTPLIGMDFTEIYTQMTHS